jgi:hypothetical protein
MAHFFLTLTAGFCPQNPVSSDSRSGCSDTKASVDYGRITSRAEASECAAVTHKAVAIGTRSTHRGKGIHQGSDSNAPLYIIGVAVGVSLARGGRRDCEREPSIPAFRPVFCSEFPESLEVDLTPIGVIDRKDVAYLGSDPGHT